MTRLRPVLLLVVASFSCSLFGLETELKPGMDRERQAMIARWKETLTRGEQSGIEKVLVEATEKASVAFGMSDWPRAVAEKALNTEGLLQEMLLNHLRQHHGLINDATQQWIKELFKRDVLDPAGEQVRTWTAAGGDGLLSANGALKGAAEGQRWDEVAALLDAMARCGNQKFLPLAAPYLGHENNQVSQAALGVFKAHAKDLGPDVRSPKLCRIWWLQSGKALFEGK